MKKLHLKESTGVAGKGLLNHPLAKAFLNNLSGEQIKGLVTGLQGEGYEVEGGDNWLETILKVVPPEVIQSFAGKILGGQKEGGFDYENP